MCKGLPCATLAPENRHAYYEDYDGTGTPYLSSERWRSVRQAKFLVEPTCHTNLGLVILLHPACACCSRVVYDYASPEDAKRQFVVHHKCYRHVFEEIDHLDDLEVLCHSCHEREHGRL